MSDDPLPTALAIFPLQGVLLLPGNSLPLHIFEPRYRNLVEDALAGPKVIGMIQPRGPVAEEDLEEPPLYTVGCAGRIHRSQQLPDGRYLILLVGLTRFRVRAELPGLRGYRRVEAAYEEFGADGQEPSRVLPDLTPLLSDVQSFGTQHGLEVDISELASIPPPQLVNGLAAALPFSPAEKQALLEAPDPLERTHVLAALLAMSGGPLEPDGEEPLAN
jgi:uncharacterized protein